MMSTAAPAPGHDATTSERPGRLGSARLPWLCLTTALATILTPLCAGPQALAQDASFVGTETTSGPFSSGTQYFLDSSALNASAANAVNGGFQWFLNSSALNASAANAVSEGSQSFNDSSALNTSVANAVSGGAQFFYDGSMLNAAATGAVSDGSQSFFRSSILNVGATNALTTGTNIFFDNATGGLGGTLRLNGYSTTIGSINSLTAGSGVITNGGASDSVLRVDTSARASTFSGVIQDGAGGGRLGLTLAAGNLTLTGTSTYTGGTTVTGGTLQAGSVGGFVNNTAYVVNGGTLDLNGHALTMSSLSGTGGTVALGSATLAIDQASNTSYGGAITGTGVLVKQGVGTLALTGLNSYAGATTVNEGALTIRGGGTLGNGFGYIGNDAASTGAATVDGTGSTWTNSNNLYVGYSSTGTLTIQNGGKVIGGRDGYIGNSADSTGVATVDGVGSVWDNSSGSLYVGQGGSGTLTVRNGGKVNNIIGYIGNNFGSTGAATVDGVRSSWTSSNDLYVGGAGSGTLTIQNGGKVSSSGYGRIADNFNSTGTVTVDGSGSSWTSGSKLYIGYYGAGSLTVRNDGTVKAGSVTIASQQGSSGVLAIGAELGQTAAAPGMLNSRAITFGAGTGSIVFNHTATDYIFAPVISGAGSIRVEAGTTTLTGTGSSVGAVTVDGGALAFGQTGAFNATSYTTQSGAATSIGGTAQLTVAGTFTQASGSTLNVAIGANDPAITAATASLAGTLNVSGYAGSQYTVIHTTGGITGDFGSVSIGGATSPVDYMAAIGGISGNDYVIHTGLTWNAGPAQGHGTFTLTGASEAFDVGVALTNQAGPFASGWDSRSLTKEGSGRLTLSALNSYTGTTTINGGTLAIAATGGITSDVTNNATFENAGTITGSLTQSAGTTTNNGTITGAVTVSGGLFTGIGAAGALTANSGGTVAPGVGGGIGAMSVAGNVTFNPGSIYRVAINAAGQGSRIDATGAISLNGGTVNVLAGAGTYAPATTYTILNTTTNGGRTGTFDGVSSNLAFLTPSLGYDASNVYLTMARNDISFAAIGNTRNQRATGAGVETLGLGNAVWNAVVQLDAPGARGAFDQLSGEIHASAKTALIEDSRFVRDAATDRIRAAFGGVDGANGTVTTYVDGKPQAAAATTDRLAVWGYGFGTWGSTNGDGNAARLARSTGGFLMGADAPVFDSWRLGVIGGYSRTSFNARDRQSSGSSDNYHLGLYGGTQFGNLGLRTGLAYTWHDIVTSRSVSFPGFSDSLKGDYRAGTFQAFGDLGYKIDTPLATFEPFANLAYVNLSTDGFGETGGAAALRAGGQDTAATFSTLGLRAATGFELGGLNLTTRGALGWRHAFGDTTPLSRQAFATGGAFTIAGVPIARDAAVVEAGLDLNLTPAATLGLSYHGQIAANAQDHGFNAKLNARF